MAREVEVPFADSMKDAAKRGDKTWTTRGKRYGGPGDWFVLDGFKFRIVEVRRMALGSVAAYHFKEEGFKSEAEFWALWKKLHPKAEVSVSERKWVHVFRRVSP